MSLEDIPLPSPPPDLNLRGRISTLFSRGPTDTLVPTILSDPADSESDLTSRKRVGFHPWTTNILEPQLSTPDSEIPTSLKSLPPSRDCLLTVRPILKPSLSSQSVLGIDEQVGRGSTIDNMDSLLRNLDNNERSISVDAYQTMTSLIKTYDEPPEQEILQKKMSQLQKHIKRDLVVLDAVTDALPSEERLSKGNLILSALKVLVTIVWSPVYSPCLTDDFRTWTVERAIRVLKQHIAPKAVLLHYMHILATQNFRQPLIIQANRVYRILDALQELTDHVSGKAVVAERLLVYQKLIQQAKPTMKARPDLWIKNILTALGHSFKEVRGNAVSAGTEACTAYSGTNSVSTAARDALAEISSERTLSASITNRLERVLAAKDEANQIPQIWTLVLLLCNGGQQKLDSWPQLHDWLKLIQRCFNSSDMTVRVQAFLAWNRLYFIARPHEASDKVVSMLAKPAIVQLDRTGNNQSSKGTRQAVISSYCMLLYYAFRPSASPSQYTRMWNEFVVKLMTRSFLSKSGANCDLCCRILAALFYSSLSRTRVWNENRAHENAALDPLELPAIDCKWIRSRTLSILSIFQLLVDYSSFGPSTFMSEQAYAPQAWRNLMQAIKESTSKEIKPSTETKTALNGIVDFLSPSADDPDALSEDATGNVERLSLLAGITVVELGPTMILQGLEYSSNPVNIVLLEALVGYVSKMGDDVFSQNLPREKFVERCLQLLRTEVESTNQSNSGSHESSCCLVLDRAESILKQLGDDRGLQILLVLQEPVSNLLQDQDNQFLAESVANRCAVAYQKFSSFIISLISRLDRQNHEVVNELIAVTARSTHSWIAEFGKTRLNEKRTQDENRAERPSSKGSVAGQDFHTRLQSTRRSGKTIAADQDLQVKADRKTRSNGSTPVLARPRRNKSKPRHEDSQIEFVAIEPSSTVSAPESQFLTTHQKEVRARQSAEPILTFADIRSSPIGQRRQALILEEKPEHAETVDPPGTPTLPISREREDDEQPPTPTPKARKSRRLNLQPEITSSPPSVVDDDQTATGIHITSSPIKDVIEGDDAISFEDVDRNIIADDHKEDLLATGQRQDQRVPPIEDNNDKPIVATGIVLTETPFVSSTNGEYETAEPDRSSPTAYSDEYDALAASQLSQGLVEESSFMTTRLDDEDTTQSARKTRKRKGDHLGEPTSTKKQKGSIEANVDDLDSRNTGPGKDTEHTIYVSMQKSTAPSPRITRARAAQESFETSQMSQRSSASNTPNTQKSKSSRKRGRPRKKQASRSSRDTSLSSQALSSPSHEHDAQKKPAASDTGMVDSQSIADLPSLGSEVDETAESQDRRDLHPDVLNVPVAEVGLVEPAEQPVVTEIPEMDPEPVDVLIMQPTSPTSEKSTTISPDIIGSLQNILDNMTNNPEFDATTLDLASIHSLCFRIGLKAQELATR